MSKLASALVSGIIFGLGLTLSGMTNPDKVLAFLTLDRSWDATLIFVLISALITTAIGYAIVDKRSQPLCDSEFHKPGKTAIDGRLLGGAMLFGLGWGLAGYCPGPAIVGALTLDPRAWIFAAGLVAGMPAFEKLPSSATPQRDDA
jgi:uncharacterized membrane protein YedE/YeeE